MDTNINEASPRAALAAIEKWLVLEELAKCGLVPDAKVKDAERQYAAIVCSGVKG